MSEQKPISKMTREELEAEATRLGIEEPGKVPTVKELRSLISAYAESAQNGSQTGGNDESGIPDGSDDPEPPESSQNGEGGTPDADQDGDQDQDDEPAPADPEVVPIPTGCVVVFGLELKNRCSFFEQDSRHPDGEVFIKGGEFGIAFPTPALMRAVGRSLALVEPK